MHIFSYVNKVILPITIGCSIYTCYRPTSLRIYNWYKFIGLEDKILYLRATSAPLKQYLPDWVIYCLPNGLWVYAYTAYMLLVWRRGSTAKLNSVWPHLGIMLGLASEIFQIFGVIHGTFDIFDCSTYILFYFIALIMIRHKSENIYKENYLEA